MIEYSTCSIHFKHQMSPLEMYDESISCKHLCIGHSSVTLCSCSVAACTDQCNEGVRSNVISFTSRVAGITFPEKV